MFVNKSVKNAVLMMLMTAMISFFGLGTIQIKAAWGDYDPSFATGGIYEDAATGSVPLEAFVQPDGKILLTGYNLASNGKKRMMLRRWTANGAIDTTFGNNGNAVIIAPINVNNDYTGTDITMLSNGKIAVVGQSGNNVAVWIVDSNGSGDANFGYGGMKTLSDYAHKAEKEKIVASGSKPIVAVYDANLECFVLLKLNLDGTPDTTYGTNGVSQTNLIHDKFAYGLPRIDMIIEGDTKKTVIIGLTYPNVSMASLINFDRKTANGSDDFSFTPSAVNGTGFTISRIFRLKSGTGYIYDRSYTSTEPDIQTYITKLNYDGTFNIELASTYSLFPTGIQSDGRIVTGSFTGDGHNSYGENLVQHGSGAFVGLPDREILQPDDKTIQFSTHINGKLKLIRRLKI